jgi:hypothetical protein
MRRLLTIAAVLLLLAVIVMVALAISLNRIIEYNRDRILVAVATQIGRSVDAAAISVSLSGGLGIRVTEPRVAEDAAFGKEPFLDAASVTARARLWPLLRGELEFVAVDLLQPQLRLLRNAAGAWNFETLNGLRSARVDARPSPMRVSSPWPGALVPAAFAATPESEGADFRWAVNRATVRQATVHIVDSSQRPATTTRIEGIDATLTDLSMQQAIRFDIELRLPHSTATASASGSVGPLSREPIPVVLQAEAGPFGEQAVDVEVSKLDSVLEKDRFVVRAIEGRTCDGTFSATGAFALGGTGATSLEGQLRDADIAQALSLTAAPPGQFQGAAHLRFQLRSSGSPPDDLAGTVVAEVKNGALTGFNLLDEVLRNVAPLPGLAEAVTGRLKPKYGRLFTATETRFQVLQGSFRIADRRVRTDDLTVTAEDFGARATGSVDFDQRVDISGDVVIGRQLTADLTADVKELKYLTEDDGQLALPFRVRGTLGKAKPRPDSERITATLGRALGRGAAQDLLEGLLGGAKDKGSPTPGRSESLERGLRELFGR